MSRSEIQTRLGQLDDAIRDSGIPVAGLPYQAPNHLSPHDARLGATPALEDITSLAMQAYGMTAEQARAKGPFLEHFRRMLPAMRLAETGIRRDVMSGQENFLQLAGASESGTGATARALLHFRARGGAIVMLGMRKGNKPEMRFPAVVLTPDDPSDETISIGYLGQFYPATGSGIRAAELDPASPNYQHDMALYYLAMMEYARRKTRIGDVPYEETRTALVAVPSHLDMIMGAEHQDAQQIDQIARSRGNVHELAHLGHGSEMIAHLMRMSGTPQEQALIWTELSVLQCRLRQEEPLDHSIYVRGQRRIVHQQHAGDVSYRIGFNPLFVADLSRQPVDASLFDFDRVDNYPMLEAGFRAQVLATHTDPARVIGTAGEAYERTKAE